MVAQLKPDRAHRHRHLTGDAGYFACQKKSVHAPDEKFNVIDWTRRTVSRRPDQDRGVRSTYHHDGQALRADTDDAVVYEQTADQIGFLARCRCQPCSSGCGQAADAKAAEV